MGDSCSPITVSYNIIVPAMVVEQYPLPFFTSALFIQMRDIMNLVKCPSSLGKYLPSPYSLYSYSLTYLSAGIITFFDDFVFVASLRGSAMKLAVASQKIRLSSASPSDQQLSYNTTTTIGPSSWNHFRFLVLLLLLFFSHLFFIIFNFARVPLTLSVVSRIPSFPLLHSPSHPLPLPSSSVFFFFLFFFF